jgi:hypothetical protein
VRTTLNIDDDVLIAAKKLAKAQGTTAGRVISDLARKARSERSPVKFEWKHGFSILPRRGGRVTSEIVDRLSEDEEP